MINTRQQGSINDSWAPISSDSAAQRVLPSIVLAPSAHNTQPWKFAVHRQTIDLYIDWRRHLHISDPTHRQTYISLGCALANAIIAARYWQHEPAISFFPDGAGDNKPVVRLKLLPSRSADESIGELFAAIDDRRTDRSLYDAKPLSLDEEAALATDDSAVILIKDRKIIRAIADLTGQSTAATLSRHDFKRELSGWVRNNWTRRDDGMPGYAMGMPAPVSLLSSFMVRFAPIHKQEAPKTREQIASSSAIAIIATAQDTPTAWLRAGQQLEMIWLQATAAGLAAAPLVAAIESSAETRQQLRQAIKTDLLPQSIIRLGHTSQKNIKASPRRSVEDCLL